MEILALVASAVAVIAVVVALVLGRRLGALARRVERLESRAPVGEGDLLALQGSVDSALSRVAVVRYDAFGDLGGRLSFSAALLDGRGDGIVLTSIHGRTESRTYAKGVAAGGDVDSASTLTPEERQAVAAARQGSPTA